MHPYVSVGQRGIQFNSNKSHIFVYKIITVVITSVYVKYISGLKIIQKTFLKNIRKKLCFFIN